jgi:hypothetical protein
VYYLCPSNIQLSKNDSLKKSGVRSQDSESWLLTAGLSKLLPAAPSETHSVFCLPPCAAWRRSRRDRLVGLGRIELPTSPLSGVRSSQLSYRPGDPGGAGRDRTGDLLNANQALSQLSYSPAFLPRPVGRKDLWSSQRTTSLNLQNSKWRSERDSPSHPCRLGNPRRWHGGWSGTAANIWDADSTHVLS